jgi:beta-phosphoglucomutase-like phosphatase (HAD superfamily)
MIKAVIFDVDGVLLDSFEANLKLFQNLMKAAGYQPPTREQYALLFHKTLRDTVQVLTGIKDESEVKKICDLIDGVDAPPPILTDGVADIIKNLRDHYILGIVTSRIKAYAYEPPLNALEHYFKTTITYEDTENHKPHPEPLLLAATQLNVLPEECVYVGDAKTDMEAARAAGTRSILYSQEKIDGADAIAADFREIPQLIATLSS